jgi:hypothetical protein
MEDPVVVLRPNEFFYASTIGVMRQIKNLQNNRTDRYGARKEDGWRLHIEGACGECAFAKWMGFFWSGALENLNAPDVGRYEIRTRSREDYDLIVHPQDSDDARFCLVVGTAPRFRLAGFILGREAKQQKWWSDPAGGRPAFFVPQQALHPVHELQSDYHVEVEL